MPLRDSIGGKPVLGIAGTHKAWTPVSVMRDHVRGAAGAGAGQG